MNLNTPRQIIKITSASTIILPQNEFTADDGTLLKEIRAGQGEEDALPEEIRTNQANLLAIMESSLLHTQGLNGLWTSMVFIFSNNEREQILGNNSDL
jgi:hypothetical protein